MSWQLQEAKQKFSKLVRQALAEGPQVITRHGEEVVVVLSTEDYRRLTKRRPDAKEVLLSGPYVDLEIRRASEPARVIDFE